MPNGVDAKLDAWANFRGWSEDPCAASVILRLSCVSYAAICVNDLICLPPEWLWDQVVIGQLQMCIAVDFWSMFMKTLIRVRGDLQ